MNIFVISAVGIVAAMAGFWAGRSVTWQLAEVEGIGAGDAPDLEEEFDRNLQRAEESDVESQNRRWGNSKPRKKGKTISLGREIGSPVTGQVSIFEEDGRRKMRLLPDQGKVYAPVAGRIRHLYPMGRAMLLQTEFGAEILLQAGSHVDEMCSGYYRCRVMEHEYVRKGTLLLEYDPASLCAEGAEPEVLLSIENEADLGKMTVAARPRMKAGEPILYLN